MITDSSTDSEDPAPHPGLPEVAPASAIRSDADRDSAGTSSSSSSASSSSSFAAAAMAAAAAALPPSGTTSAATATAAAAAAAAAAATSAAASAASAAATTTAATTTAAAASTTDAGRKTPKASGKRKLTETEVNEALDNLDTEKFKFSKSTFTQFCSV